MKHKYFESRTQIVNQETGEIEEVITSEKKFVYDINTDSFFMTFIDFMAPLLEIKGRNTKTLLSWMCANAEYNTGKIYIPAPRIKQLSQNLNITKQCIYNGFVELKKLGLITGERGAFQLNPEIFWKGDIQARKRLLESNGNKVSVTFAIAQEEYDSHK